MISRHQLLYLSLKPFEMKKAARRASPGRRIRHTFSFHPAFLAAAPRTLRRPIRFSEPPGRSQESKRRFRAASAGRCEPSRWSHPKAGRGATPLPLFAPGPARSPVPPGAAPAGSDGWSPAPLAPAPEPAPLTPTERAKGREIPPARPLPLKESLEPEPLRDEASKPPEPSPRSLRLRAAPSPTQALPSPPEPGASGPAGGVPGGTPSGLPPRSPPPAPPSPCPPSHPAGPGTRRHSSYQAHPPTRWARTAARRSTGRMGLVRRSPIRTSA
jgi:hypothetical protein